MLAVPVYYIVLASGSAEGISQDPAFVKGHTLDFIHSLAPVFLHAGASTRVTAPSCLDSRSTATEHSMAPGSRPHADAHSNWRTSRSEVGPSGFFRDRLDREEGVGAKSIEVTFQVGDEVGKVVYSRVQGRNIWRGDEISSNTKEGNLVVPAKVRRNEGDNVYRGMLCAYIIPRRMQWANLS